MNVSHAIPSSRSTLRAAILLVGLYLALAVGVPWLLLDAPPSPEAAFVTKLWSVATPAAPAAAPVRTLAPGR